MHSKIILALALIALILLAGCLDSGDDDEGSVEQKTPKTPGLVITDFSSFPWMEEDEDIDVNLDVQNQGGSDATNIAVDLYMHDDFALISGTWKQTIDYSLLGPDPTIGSEGDTLSTYWTVRAPQVPDDQKKTFTARVTYDYNTTATTNVILVHRDEYREQGAEAFHTYSTSSVGPLSIRIIPKPAIRINNASTESKNATIDILFENTGNGRVVGDNITYFEFRDNGLDITNTDNLTCRGYQSGEIALFGDEQQRSVRCEVNLSYESPSVSHIIEITAGYSYYTDTPPLSVSVENYE